MADPGDPFRPKSRDGGTNDATDDLFGNGTVAPFPHDEDDLVGFSSIASLAGRTRAAPMPASGPDTVWPPVYPQSDASAHVEPDLEDPDLFEPPARSLPTIADRAQAPHAIVTPPYAAPAVDPNPLPAWAMETATNPVPAATAPTRPARPTFGRSTRGQPVAAEGLLGLYAVYALILFAVPTFGVAALIGLIAVFTRPLPEQPLALSHHLFQTRTLKSAAIAAVVGAALIAAPLGIGVLVLFLLAVWTIARGAWGVLTLKAGRTIARPATWLISETR